MVRELLRVLPALLGPTHHVLGQLGLVDPELELRAAARRFRARVETADALAAADGKDWTTLPLDEQDAYFDKAKEQE